MELPLVQVDAFADRPFTGNPAAVMRLPRWLDDDVLAAIAAENNLSETAFVVEEPGGLRLRWFTQFLGDMARLDLGPAVDAHGGAGALRFRSILPMAARAEADESASLGRRSNFRTEKPRHTPARSPRALRRCPRCRASVRRKARSR